MALGTELGESLGSSLGAVLVVGTKLMLGVILRDKLGFVEGMELADDVGCIEVVGDAVEGDVLGTLLMLGISLGATLIVGIKLMLGSLLGAILNVGTKLMLG